MAYNSSLMIDRSLTVRKRIALYFWTVVSECEVSSQKGVRVLFVMKTFAPDPRSQAAIHMVLDVVPLRLHCVHIAICPEIYATKFSERTVPLALAVLGFLSRRMLVHKAKTKKEMYEDLIKVGFTNVPECLGGTWTYEKFSQWMEHRVRYGT